MERGQIRTFNSHGSDGTIADGQGQVISFSSSSVIGRDRSGLKAGDAVWFERLGAKAATRAINVRRC